MKLKNSFLVIRQLDKKMQGLHSLQDIISPKEGWVSLLRKTLKSSQRQWGEKLSITAQSFSEIEAREKEGTITLKTLRDTADALDMKLVYGFIPKDGTLEKMIERK